MQNNLDEAFSVIMNNIDNLTYGQLSNLTFQGWAATQERNISPFQEEIDDAFRGS